MQTAQQPGRCRAAPGQVIVEEARLAGLPVINTVLARLGLDGILAAGLPGPDPRCRTATATVIGVLVRNLALGREPLYALAGWAAGYDEALLGLGPGQAAMLNDDRAGRALDELYLADRASMTTALSVAAVTGYGISPAELHNDSTSLRLYGAYRGCGAADPAGSAGPGSAPPDGPARQGGTGPARPARGHSKDRRPDLKQLVWILTTCADGAVPFTFKMADGNTEDSTTHIATWTACRAIAGHPGFLYVADSKLATTANMTYIAGQGGRFLSVLSRSRKEDKDGRDWLAGQDPGWAEVTRRPGRRKLGPPVIYHAVPAPAPSAEGYRIVWIRSSAKRRLDAASRSDRIARATAALRELAQRLDAPRCKLKTRAAIENTARQATGQARPWIRFEVTEQVTTQTKQVSRGRPGPRTRYQHIERHRFSLSFRVDQARAARDAASDGCYPLITNDTGLTPAGLLAAYKRQPRLERRHATLKGVLRATPAELKNDTRIDALGFCLYVALLIHALIERELRNAMTQAGLRHLPLYPEDRPCAAPTATRILDILSPLTRTIIRHGHQVTAVPPQLDALQKQILTMLDMTPTVYYQAARLTAASKSGQAPAPPAERKLGRAESPVSLPRRAPRDVRRVADGTGEAHVALHAAPRRERPRKPATRRSTGRSGRAEISQRRRLWVLTGAGGYQLSPQSLDVGAEGPGLVVAGPPRSGRSTTLMTVARSGRRGVGLRPGLQRGDRRRGEDQVVPGDAGQMQEVIDAGQHTQSRASAPGRSQGADQGFNRAKRDIGVLRAVRDQDPGAARQPGREGRGVHRVVRAHVARVGPGKDPRR